MRADSCCAVWALEADEKFLVILLPALGRVLSQTILCRMKEGEKKISLEEPENTEIKIKLTNMSLPP